MSPSVHVSLPPDSAQLPPLSVPLTTLTPAAGVTVKLAPVTVAVPIERTVTVTLVGWFSTMRAEAGALIAMSGRSTAVRQVALATVETIWSRLQFEKVELPLIRAAIR